MSDPPTIDTPAAEDVTALCRAQYDRAYHLAKNKKPDEAIPLFVELVRWDKGLMAKKLRREAHQQVLWCFSRVRDWTGMDEYARLAVHRYPQAPWGYRYLGEAQFRLGKMKKAIASLEKAIEIDPGSQDARVALQALRNRDKAPAVRARIRPWPARQKAMADPRQLIEQYILRDLPGEPFIRPDTVFMTLGSCFADNLARRLRDAGYQVNSEEIGEEINSTYANRHLLEWIEHGPKGAVARQMEDFYGPVVRERLRGYIESSEVFVLTLGLAPCFFEVESGRFVFLPPRTEIGRTMLHGAHQMRTTTVIENVRNLEEVLASLRRMAKRPPTVVLTVSPVPLSGTSEFSSAVIADCVSKSTLRVACHELMTGLDAADVIYWPSFEIVRWLGAHFGPDHPHVYGADDTNTRHVSDWVVRLIIDLFLERYGAGEPA